MAKRKSSNSTLKLVEIIKEGIEEKKGEEIVTLDLQKTNPSVCDYFIICHGTSNTHVGAIAEEIQEMVREKLGEKPFHVEGVSNAEWILIDYVNVVVHIFRKKSESFTIWRICGETQADKST